MGRVLGLSNVCRKRRWDEPADEPTPPPPPPPSAPVSAANYSSQTLEAVSS